MPKSEIDDIFASKGKRKLAQPIASSSTAPPPPTKSKKNKKKRKTPAPHAESPSSPKRPAPETVVDPSTGGDSQPPPKRRKSVKPIETPAAKDKKNRPAEDDERFKDSRGTGPRRKTDDGFAIFKEDELGINPEVGGTPLCPFDCDCCF